MKIAVTVIHILITLVLITSVLLQQGKDAGLSGAIGGGNNNDSFFGKNKSRTFDGFMSRVTAISAVLFIITSLVLALVFR